MKELKDKSSNSNKDKMETNCTICLCLTMYKSSFCFFKAKSGLNVLKPTSMLLWKTECVEKYFLIVESPGQPLVNNIS